MRLSLRSGVGFIISGRSSLRSMLRLTCLVSFDVAVVGVLLMHDSFFDSLRIVLRGCFFMILHSVTLFVSFGSGLLGCRFVYRCDSSCYCVNRFVVRCVPMSFLVGSGEFAVHRSCIRSGFLCVVSILHRSVGLHHAAVVCNVSFHRAVVAFICVHRCVIACVLIISFRSPLVGTTCEAEHVSILKRFQHTCWGYIYRFRTVALANKLAHWI